MALTRFTGNSKGDTKARCLPAKDARTARVRKLSSGEAAVGQVRGRRRRRFVAAAPELGPSRSRS